MPFKDSKDGQTHSYNDGCIPPQVDPSDTPLEKKYGKDPLRELKPYLKPQTPLEKIKKDYVFRRSNGALCFSSEPNPEIMQSDTPLEKIIERFDRKFGNYDNSMFNVFKIGDAKSSEKTFNGIKGFIAFEFKAGREEMIEMMEQKLEKFQTETEGNESDLFRGIEKGYENMIEYFRNQ